MSAFAEDFRSKAPVCVSGAKRFNRQSGSPVYTIADSLRGFTTGLEKANYVPSSISKLCFSRSCCRPGAKCFKLK